MSLVAALLIALVFAPAVLLTFLLDPGGFLARNGLLTIAYVAVATTGTVLYLSAGVALVGTLSRKYRSRSRRNGSR